MEKTSRLFSFGVALPSTLHVPILTYHFMIFMFKDTTMHEDVISLVHDPDHKFSDYEMRQIVWLRKHLRKAVSIWNEDKPTIGNGHEVALGNQLTV